MGDRTNRSGSGGAPLNRRRFLRLLGAASGSGAVLAAMDAWGMGIASKQEAPPRLSQVGDGKRVVILGAGVAGMTAAYELRKWGYQTPILEARDFAGGRVQTIRKGSVRTEIGGSTQRCEFDEGHYLNNGAWRIPHNHRSTLHYTREFDVPLEIMVNQNDRGWVVPEDVEGPLSGRRMRQGAVKADMRGYTAEILAKSIHQDELDLELSADDRERLLEYLRDEGYLQDPDLAYTGTEDRGYEERPGVEPGVPSDPYDFLPLLRSGAGNSFSAVEENALMFQAVGGMDRIAAGFEREVGRHIIFNAEVREIRQDDEGVRVGYRNTRTGETGQITADYCFCTIPLSVLMRIPADFSASHHRAMRMVSYQPVGKMGLQFGRRFWEEDDAIYGGHSVSNGPVGRISYPSYRYQDEKGVVQAYYGIGTDSIAVSAMSPDERIEYALKHGSRFHPDSYREEFETGFSFFWHLSKYNRGGWAEWSARAREEAYPVLMEPDGRIYLAGEHLSYITAWVAGAIESAWAQIEKLHERASREEQA